LFFDCVPWVEPEVTGEVIMPITSTGGRARDEKSNAVI